MKDLIHELQSHPRAVSFFGMLSGWLSVDYLRAAQITAAVLASLATLCSVILVARKTIVEVRSWFR